MKFKEWVSELLQEVRIRRSVPYTCYHCELLGICRDEQNRWKCRHGCMILNFKKKRIHNKKVSGSSRGFCFARHQGAGMESRGRLAGGDLR